MSEEHTLPGWLEPLRDASAKKHRSSGIKVRPSEPAIVKVKPGAACRVTPDKMRFATAEEAINFRIGRDRDWIRRTETYWCSCGGFHFRRKKEATHA